MPTVKDLEYQQIRMDKNLARLRKAATLPKATVRRFRGNFRALVVETFDIANTLKDFYLFGGFNVEPDHLPKLSAFLERYSRTEACRQIKKRIVRAILAGDRPGVYTELIGLRLTMREFFEGLSVYESPAFRERTTEEASF